jgi:hypothetical protein
MRWTARPLEMGPTGSPEASVVISLRCVTTHKVEDLVITAAKP